MIGKEEDCQKWADKNQIRKDSPIYYVLKIKGVQQRECELCKGTGKVLSIAEL